MFRSLSRVTVAVAFVLALALSTVPVQAQPIDAGRFASVDASWIDIAFNWLEGLLGGGDSGSLQTMETGGAFVSTGGEDPDMSVMGGSCIDPFGGGGGCDW